MSVKTKIKIARIKLFFTKKRYMGNHPKSKKFITVAFLAGVNSFIFWNLSISMPEIEINFPSGSVVYENKAMAKEVVKEKEVEKPKEIKTCADAVEVYGKEYGNTDLLGRIVKAESTFDHKAKSKTTTARGCAQFVVGTWEQYGREHWGEDFYTKNVYSPKDNVELLAWAVSTKGTGDWNASRAAWAQ